MLPDSRRSDRSGCLSGRASTAREVHELGVALEEREHDVADRPVAVLGDDHVGLARALGVAVVVLVAVDEHDDVGVLLDLPRLAQVRELRLRRRPLLGRPRELGDRDDRHLELAGEDL